MATAHAHDAHAHGGHGGDHVPHVLPLGVYFGVFAALIVFTGITVGVSYIDLGPANLIVALVVATMKALMVAFIFMHLAFDKKFNTLVFASALIFLAIFIGITMMDTNGRNLGGRTSADAPVSLDNPFGGTKADEALKAVYEKKKAFTESKTGKEEPVPHDEKVAPAPSAASPDPSAHQGGTTPTPSPAPAGGGH